jgi:anaerobic selenocysteine-containing dehydrogenase
LQLCPPEIAAELNQVFEETPDARFRYQLTCRRILEALNSAFIDLGRTRKKHPLNWAFMNPDDMRAENLQDGDTIKIASEHGAIIAIAKPEDRLRRGVVSMTHMFGGLAASNDPIAQRGSYTGRLTSLDKHVQSINFMPRFSGVPINVSRYSPS